MTAGVLQDVTERVWMRSREEEGGPVRVYRPEGYPFPPTRSREGLVLHADGGFDYLGPSRGDRPSRDSGTWRSDPSEPTRITAEVGNQKIEFRILEVTGGVLRLEWPRP